MRFIEAAKFCEQFFGGRLTDFFSFTDLKLSVEILHSKKKFATDMIWLPYKHIGTGPNFVNLYMNQTLDSSFWMFNEPSLDNMCVICHTYGCQTADCWEEHEFFCSSENWPIVAKVRGLCIDTSIALSYYLDFKLGYVAWLSTDGTYIIYNSTSENWQIGKADRKISAQSPATYDSILLGNHHWTFSNDYACLEGKTTALSVSLALCNAGQFNCDSGACTKLSNKCDGKNDCLDGSDELNCQVVHVPYNYNKQLSPFYWSKDKVNITFEVVSVLNVDEKMGRIRAKFTMGAAWYDYRLDFLDLWGVFTMNTLSETEMNLIWQPVIEYENAELENFNYHRKLEIAVLRNTTFITRTPSTELYKSKVYNGAFNSLLLRAQIRFVEKYFYIQPQLSCRGGQ
jgi:hypothetical protein